MSKSNSINNVEVDICLATYNGARWIAPFLDSLVAQTHTKWRLIVSDDASTDQTLDVIGSYFSGQNNKLVVVRREQTGLGVVRNFQDALEASRSDYVLLADQDDVWQPEKISTLLLLMQKTEQENKKPSLVFSDLEVVDEQLKTLNKSWWSYTSVKPKWVNSFKVMLVQNIVPGCAMMINRNLLKLAMPFPNGVAMHDWWLLLTALSLGGINYTETPLVLYRRHSEAQTYSGDRNLLAVFRRQILAGYEIRKHHETVFSQALVFRNLLEKYSEAKEGDREVIGNYINAMGFNRLNRRFKLIRMGVHLITAPRTFKFYLWI